MKILVSGFKSVTDSSNPYNRDVFKYLDRIQKGNSKETVEAIRSEDDKEIRSKLKMKLPGICFSGTFSTRSEIGLIKHSGLLVLDFDGFETLEDTTGLKDSISDLPYVFACFISPSGNGVKALVKIPADATKHKNYFNSIRTELNIPQLDDSGKDVSRFCFESYDPDIYINPECETYLNYEEDDIEEVGYEFEEVLVPQKSESIIINNLMTWFNSKYGANQGSRNSNLFKLSMAFNDFGINQNVALQKLMEFQQKDFNGSEIKKLCDSAYKRGNHSFGSKCFEDKQTRVKLEKKIRSGKKVKEIQNWVKAENITVENVESVVEKVKETMQVEEFWQYDHNGKIKLTIHAFKFWLEQNNFMKYFPTNSGTFQFIKKEQNLIEITDENRIKDFTLDDLINRTDVGYGPYDFMAGNVGYFNMRFLSFLKSADVVIKSDTQDACYLYFKNCAVEVKDNSIKEIDYLDLDGYVWKNQIIDRDYVEADHHDSEFRKFIWLVSGQDVNKYNTFKSVVGYLLHSYKTSANNKAIIFNDETISDNPNGGSGKGLFWNALSKMKKVSMIDGKTFDFGKSFPYQTISTDCQLLVFDDVKKNFNFEALFSVITEGLTIEYKGQDAIKIPVEKSPKILITTNYTVGGVGGSFDRRKFEIEMSSYFNSTNTPLDEFGHLLFDGWDEAEWSRFDNFMIQCVQYFLQNGLVENEFNNLHLRKFIKATCFEFYEWTKELNSAFTLNTRHSKKEYYDKLLEDYADLKRWLSQKRFKSMLEEYAKFYEYEYFEGNSNGQRWFMIGKSEVIDAEEQDNPF